MGIENTSSRLDRFVVQLLSLFLLLYVTSQAYYQWLRERFDLADFLSLVVLMTIAFVGFNLVWRYFSDIREKVTADEIQLAYQMGKNETYKMLFEKVNNVAECEEVKLEDDVKHAGEDNSPEEVQSTTTLTADFELFETQLAQINFMMAHAPAVDAVTRHQVEADMRWMQEANPQPFPSDDSQPSPDSPPPSDKLE